MARDIGRGAPRRRLPGLLDHRLEPLGRGARGKVCRPDHRIELLVVQIDDPDIAKRFHPGRAPPREFGAYRPRLGMSDNDQRIGADHRNSVGASRRSNVRLTDRAPPGRVRCRTPRGTVHRSPLPRTSSPSSNSITSSPSTTRKVSSRIRMAMPGKSSGHDAQSNLMVVDRRDRAIVIFAGDFIADRLRVEDRSSHVADDGWNGCSSANRKTGGGH